MSTRSRRCFVPRGLIVVTLMVGLTMPTILTQPVAAAPPVPPPVSFDTAAGPNTFDSVGQDPDHVIVADLNGDMIPDLVVVNTTATYGPPAPGLGPGVDFVSVLIGNGNGTFRTPKAIATGTTQGDGPAFVTVADFNGDGQKDLAITLTNGPVSGDPAVVIAFGDGNGNFTADTNALHIQQRTFSSVPSGIVAGDFNKDGFPDLAVLDTNQTSCDFTLHTCANGSVLILLGDGNGGFSAPTPFAVGISPWNVVVGDFNNDGNQDLAVTNAGITGNVAKTVSILLGDGHGVFSAAAPVTVGSAPQGLAIGDFNGDGFQDLAVANSGNGTVSIVLGNGNGTFHTMSGSPYPVGAGPASVAIADFNGDGKLDVVSSDTNAPGAGTMSVLLGNGDGTFQPKTAFTLPKDPTKLPNPNPAPPVQNPDVADNAGPIFVAVGDFNGDGKPDVALPDVFCQLSYCLVTVILNTSPFTAKLNVAAPPTVVAGSAPNLTVTAQKLTNATALTYTGTVTLTSSDASAVLPPNYTFTTGGGNDNGVHTFSAGSSVTLKTAGPQMVTVTDTTYSSITGQATITVTAAPTAPTLTNVPAMTVVGTPFTATVTSQDQFGNTVPGVVTFQSTDPKATLPASVTFTAGGPASQQVSITLKTPGGQSVTATNTTLSPNLSGTANVTATAAALVSIAVTPANATLKVGQMQQYTATATYADNTTADITAQVTWSSDANAVAAMDVAATGKVTGQSPGTAQIKATQGSMVGQTRVTVSGPTPIGISVPPAPTGRSSGTTSEPGSSPPPAPGARSSAAPVSGAASQNVSTSGSSPAAAPSGR